jgi:hypothetical protein
MQPFAAVKETIRRVNRDVFIRAATISDAAGFTALMNRYYARKKSGTYFKWQFLECPFPAQLFLAEAGGSVVGSYGIQIFPLSTGVRAGFTIDLLLDDKYRMRGLFVLLEERVEQFATRNGARLLASLPNSAGATAHSGLPSWQRLGDIIPLTVSKEELHKPSLPPAGARPDSIAFARDASYLDWR